jgi:type II secretion system protein G
MRKGFTLIEMLVVLLIIAVLALIVLPRILNARRKAMESATYEIIVDLNKAVECFEADVGCYPTTVDVLVSNPGDNYAGKAVQGNSVGDLTISDASTLWRGPYLKDMRVPVVPVDRAASWTILLDSTTTLGVVKITGTTKKGMDGTYYTDW